LAEAGASIVAYEVDRRLRPLLAETTAGLDVDLHFADAMDVDFATELSGTGWKLVANLPYQIGTPLLLDLLRQVPAISDFTVMVQLEVALRLIAEPGSEYYGLPSVVVGLHAEVLIYIKLSPQLFYPRPKVQSAVVGLRRKPAPPLAERAIELAGAAFGQRRKMVRGSLRGVLDDPDRLLARAGIEPTRRSEDLSPSDYLRLAEVAGA
jgi:16S rRNA (adenine1518-N6/adenine1519-N6)-dimethyltransferase